MWYESLKKHSIKRERIVVSEEFVRYFVESDFIVPPELSLGPSTSEPDDALYLSAKNDLSRLSTFGKRVLERFKSGVVPRMADKAPSDAVWIQPGETLRCASMEDVFMLLKASDRVSDRIVYKRSERIEIELRQWSNLTASREFRCFLKGRRLICISQRNYRTFFPFLLDTAEQEKIKKTLSSFFEDIGDKVDELYQDTMLRVDVYVDRQMKTWIVDLSPLTVECDHCLFSFEEIETLQELELRVLPSQIAMQPCEHIMQRLPQDIVDLSTSDGIEAFAQAMRDGSLNGEEA